MAVITLLHPGAMGARVGGELAAAGHEVRWLPTGRSEATAARAAAEGLQAAKDVAALLDGADVVVSVCPPQGALDVARLVAGAGFRGTYVDANPVSVATVAELASVVEKSGAVLVDAGIVGPPPRDEHLTHLYLSGPPEARARVAALVAGTRLVALEVGDRIGVASAAKQAYAFFNKGRLVLAAAAVRLAERHGVVDVLAGESHRAAAGVLGDPTGLRDRLAEVGWRWAPELAEVAATIEADDDDPDAAVAHVARGLEQVLRSLDGDRSLGQA